MRKQLKWKKGFTVVELIVVLVILAILAAILIPSLLGYMDKAKNTGAIAECRQCVVAAQSIATEAYADSKLTTSQAFLTAHRASILQLSGLTGTLENIRVDANTGKVTMLVYLAPSNIRVRYDSLGSTYTIVEQTQEYGLYDTFTDMLTNWNDKTKYPEYTFPAASNSAIRKYLYEKNGNSWEAITYNGAAYYVQPYWDAQKGTVTLFARTTITLEDNWNAQLIYDYENAQWYAPPKANGTIGLFGKTQEELLADIAKNNWKPISAS